MQDHNIPSRRTFLMGSLLVAPIACAPAISRVLAEPAGVVTKGSKATFHVWASTDVVGGDYMDTRYAQEWVRCEPVTDFAGEALVIMAFCDGGHPHMVRMKSTGRDRNGRFVPAGHADEAMDFMVVLVRRGDIGRFVHVLGRVVDQSRPFPKPCPEYVSLPRVA